MKTVKVIIVALSLFFSGQAFASGDSDLTNALNGIIDEYDDAPALRGNAIGDTAPEGTLTVPVSDGLYVILALAGAYMIARKRKSVSLQK